MALIKADLIASILTRPNLRREQAEEAVRVILEAMEAALVAGRRIELRGLGVFEVRPRKRRTGRNLRTGEEVPISPGQTVRFKPSRALGLQE
jgi:DNA-binding protein HU-beta